MNKTDLVNHIADATNLSKSASGLAVDAVFSAISGALASGEDVVVTGFGAFSVTERPAREGRNPQTGAAITIAAGKAPKFKVGKQLKDAVNKI